MIIRNGNVVLKNSVEKKDLLIENGKIAQIADSIPANGSQEINAAGKHVFPGLIDMYAVSACANPDLNAKRISKAAQRRR